MLGRIGFIIFPRILFHSLTTDSVDDNTNPFGSSPLTIHLKAEFGSKAGNERQRLIYGNRRLISIPDGLLLKVLDGVTIMKVGKDRSALK